MCSGKNKLELNDQDIIINLEEKKNTVKLTQRCHVPAICYFCVFAVNFIFTVCILFADVI